jgi:hypothetical protein
MLSGIINSAAKEIGWTERGDTRDAKHEAKELPQVSFLHRTFHCPSVSPAPYPCPFLFSNYGRPSSYLLAEELIRLKRRFIFAPRNFVDAGKPWRRQSRRIHSLLSRAFLSLGEPKA